MAATRIAVDVGGTFVDALGLDADGELRWAKVPNTGGDPHAAIAAAIARVTPLGARATTLLHSTTMATNALLEGKLPAIGLIVTRGFREILGVGGRGGADADSQPWELNRNGKPIVPLELVREVDERISADGSVSLGLDEESVRRAAQGFRASGIATIASLSCTAMPTRLTKNASNKSSARKLPGRRSCFRARSAGVRPSMRALPPPARTRHSSL